MRKFWLAAAAVAALVLAISVLAERQAAPSALAARKGRIVSAVLTPFGADALSTTGALEVRSSSALDVSALVRVPRGGAGPWPAAILLDGLKRGRRVALAPGLESIAARAIVVSADYPLERRRRAWEGVRFVRTALGIRPAAFDSVAMAMLLVDYLESRPDVARDRIVLIGSSLGAPIVAIAGALDPRPRAVIAAYGGGRIGGLMAHSLVVDGTPPWRAALLGHALALLVAPLSPERYVAGIAPRPFLMINGAGDSLVPRAYATALYDAARAPKELIWVPGEHVQPTEASLIASVAHVVADWLVARRVLAAGTLAER